MKRIHRSPIALLVLVFAAAAGVDQAAADDSGWIQGRATFYDDNKQGSCHYGYNIPELYAAWPDSLEGFSTSCGRCLEVACVNKDFGDAYGAWLKRSTACYDESRTVVVKIVDSCPCRHANAYSNARWCCGDMKHIDLGRPAFKILAPEGLGVIGLRWRIVDCSKLGGQAYSTYVPSSSSSQQQQWQEPPQQQQQQQWQQQPQQQQWQHQPQQQSDDCTWSHGCSYLARIKSLISRYVQV